MPSQAFRSQVIPNHSRRCNYHEQQLWKTCFIQRGPKMDETKFITGGWCCMVPEFSIIRQTSMYTEMEALKHTHCNA